MCHNYGAVLWSPGPQPLSSTARGSPATHHDWRKAHAAVKTRMAKNKQINLFFFKIKNKRVTVKI